MSSSDRKKFYDNAFSVQNWENGIVRVQIEPCDTSEDPLGYRAVFYKSEFNDEVKGVPEFVIGASFLDRRRRNILKTGFAAPMTEKAIRLLEGKIGQALINKELTSELTGEVL